MIFMTVWMGCSVHEPEVLRTDHREFLPAGTFLNSSTVGLRLPRVPEQKLNCSPASASISRLLPTDCFPMRMNCGMGKSTTPSLSCTCAFTSPSRLRSSLLEPSLDDI